MIFQSTYFDVPKPCNKYMCEVRKKHRELFGTLGHGHARNLEFFKEHGMTFPEGAVVELDDKFVSYSMMLYG